MLESQKREIKAQRRATELLSAEVSKLRLELRQSVAAGRNEENESVVIRGLPDAVQKIVPVNTDRKLSLLDRSLADKECYNAAVSDGGFDDCGTEQIISQIYCLVF